MARLVFTEPAVLDLEEIHGYISSDSVAAGRKWLTRMQNLCTTISEMPGMGRERPELGSGVRSVPASPYLIFYREITDGVEIIRVLHGSRDIEAQFQ